MSAMSASSAAAASLMPLSLIAEHKSSQPPPGVQSLPRSGSDKCVTPSNLSKPTANGMEGSGPLPLVSQVPQTATSLPAMPELNTANSDSVQLSSSHSYQPPHQNLIKPSDTGVTQESGGASFTGSGGIVTTMLSGERRHTEETTIHHHQISSSTVSTFSSVSTTTTTEQHSRSAIPAQLLQLQPSQPGIHQTSSAANIPSDSSVSAVGNTVLNATQIMPTIQPETTVIPADDSNTRNLESTQTQITLDSTSLHKQMVQQPPSGENATTPSSAQQPSVVGAVQAESPHPVASNVDTSPKSSQPQVTQTNITVPTTSVSSHQTSPTGSMITATSVTAQPPSTDNSNLKVATLPRHTAKRAAKGATSPANPTEPSKKLAATDAVKDKESGVAGDDKPRRKRLPTQPYQSPIPELNIMAKYKKMKELNEKDKVDKRPSNSSTDKLIVFYRNEFLAVRNAEGGFYVCQAMQNVYKSSSRIRIRWLSQQPEPSSDLYTPDFYDHTEFDCILTNLNLERVEKDKFRLPEAENRRTESILQRALDVERGVAPPPADDTLTETHPDGLDLSLYRNEEQLKRRKKNKKKIGKKKELSSGEEKNSSTGTTRRRVGAGGGVISASAVAKAKKAAAIKRTAAVKRVVQQAAAARRQVPAVVSSSTTSNKKAAGLNAANTISSRAQTNPAAFKKDNKVNAPTVMGKRKGATPAQGGPASEKRTRRSTPASQQQQSQQQSTTSSGTQAKARGIATASNSSNTNKNLTSNNNGGGGTNTSNGNNNTAAGGTRRTLRNSK